MNTIDLKGKKILVTGASSGLGRDISIFLSECGAQVVLVARNKNRLKETEAAMQSRNHVVISCDIGKEGSIAGMFDKAMEDGKKLDGLVHCAGIIPLMPLSTITRKSIDECMSINFSALIELVKFFSKKKNREQKSSIVEISSICSQYPGKCQTVYAASKAAANAAVQSLALELYKNGIRINSILPGTFKTSAGEKVADKIGQEAIDKMLRPQICGYLSTREISNIVAFLLCDMSSAVTGRTVYADGGYINY